MKKYSKPDVELKRKIKEREEKKFSDSLEKLIEPVVAEIEIKIDQPVPISELLKLDDNQMTRMLANKIARYFDVLNDKIPTANKLKEQIEWMRLLNLTLKKDTKDCIVILDHVVQYMALNPELVTSEKIFSLNLKLTKTKVFSERELTRYVRLMEALRSYAFNIKNKKRIHALGDVKALTNIYGFGSVEGKNINTFFSYGYE